MELLLSLLGHVYKDLLKGYINVFLDNTCVYDICHLRIALSILLRSSQVSRASNIRLVTECTCNLEGSEDNYCNA